MATPKLLLPLSSFKFSSDPKKDQWFESVRYVVDTTGLDYMHQLKDSNQWNNVVKDSKKPFIVCFYATYVYIAKV